jgi:TatD DNase family protein
MDYAYTFGEPSTLYLNVTNRCTTECTFCVRRFTDSLGSGQLRGGDEPDLPALLGAVEGHGGAEGFDEIVWCGFGEPTYRLDLIVEAAPALRGGGATIRLNTNGHGSLIHGRDVIPELAEAVDVVSVSLNAPTAERHAELCPPAVPLPGVDGPRQLWQATVAFIEAAVGHFGEVHASVVGHCLTDPELAECEALARRLGVASLRVR